MIAKKDKLSAAKGDQRLGVAARRKAPIPPGDDLGAAEMSRRVGSNLREMRKAMADMEAGMQMMEQGAGQMMNGMGGGSMGGMM